MGITSAKASVADYHLIRKVKSGKFNVDHLSQYNLCFLLGKQHFKFCVIDSRSNLCLLLEDYLLDIEQGFKRLNVLKKLFESHHLLNAGFWNTVKLAVYNSKAVLVPSSLFEKDEAAQYLWLNCQIDDSEDQVFYYKHHNGKMVNVFAGDRQIITWFKASYPNLNIHLLHHTSALIEGFTRQSDKTRLKSMALFLSNNAVDVLVQENGKLLYCNQFTYESPSEFINYVMIVLDQMGMDPNIVKVQVWGNINNQTERFKILYKYIRNISFGTRPSMLNFTFEFDEVEDYQYFDLLGMYYCE